MNDSSSLRARAFASEKERSNLLWSKIASTRTTQHSFAMTTSFKCGCPVSLGGPLNIKMNDRSSYQQGRLAKRRGEERGRTESNQGGWKGGCADTTKLSLHMERSCKRGLR